MLNAKDIAVLQGMFLDQEKRFDRKLEERLEANNHILKREIRDEMHSLMKASEAGLIRRMDEMKVEIVDGILEVLNDDVLPRVHVLEEDMIVVKHELKLA